MSFFEQIPALVVTVTFGCKQVLFWLCFLQKVSNILFPGQCREGVNISMSLDVFLQRMLLLFHYRLFYDKPERVASSTCPVAPSAKVCRENRTLRKFGPKTFGHQDMSALMPKCLCDCTDHLITETYACGTRTLFLNVRTVLVMLNEVRKFDFRIKH